MNPKLKQTRAKSKDKKADQFEIILETGKKLFLSKGARGFTMRNLAEMLGMNRNDKLGLVIGQEEILKEEFLQAMSNEKYAVTQYFHNKYLTL